MMKNLFTLLWTALFLPFCALAQTAGFLDSTFNETGIVIQQASDFNTAFFRVRTYPGNKSIAIGYVSPTPFSYQAVIARFNEDGSPDLTFSNDGVLIVPDIQAIGYDGHVLPDGKILLTGLDIGAHTVIMLRLLPDGTPDSGYGQGGMATIDNGLYNRLIYKSMIQDDGGVLVHGDYYNFSAPVLENAFVTRVLADGTVDVSYGTAGTVTINTPANQPNIELFGSGIQPDGKLVLGGRTGNTAQALQWYLLRLDAHGVVDSTFGNNGVVIKNLGNSFAEGAFDILVLADGKIIGGGYAEKSPGFHFTMVRLLPDGSTDGSFGLGGKAQISMNCCYSAIFGLIEQADGKLLACGYAAETLDHLQLAVARFKPNGIVDQSFGDGGRALFQFEPDSLSQRGTTMALQPDGKILVAGYTDSEDEIRGGVLLRLYSGLTVGTDAPQANGFGQPEVFPNPVAGNAFQLRYRLPEATVLTLSLHDLTGRKINTLAGEEWRPQGENREDLQLPEGLAPGPYFLRLETASGNATVKIFKSE